MKTTGSIWELSAPAAPQTESLRSNIDVDVLIIGGGYSGLSTALHLKNSGLDVVVIEAHSIGWGASGRNGGHVLPLIRKDPRAIIDELGVENGQRLIKMVGDSADYVFSLVKDHGIACDLEQNGWIQAIHSLPQMRIAEQRFKDWQQYNANMTLLDLRGVSDLMGSEAYVGGLLVHSGGHINPLAYARGLAKVVIEQGVKVFTDTPAMTMVQANDRWHIQTPHGKINAAKVVLATAAYSEGLWPGLEKSFLPFCLYSVATTPLNESLRSSILPGRQPVTDTRGDAHVFHYDAAGRLINGGTFIFPIGWKKRLIPHARNVLSTTFPQLASVQFESDHIWRGKIAMTADILPHIHVLAPNLYGWVGCNGRGIALATSMGRILADAVREVPTQDWLLAPVKMQAIPAHVLSKLMTSVMLAYYRICDRFK